MIPNYVSVGGGVDRILANKRAYSYCLNSGESERSDGGITNWTFENLFSKEHCPMYYQLGKTRIPTYHEFALMLSGYNPLNPTHHIEVSPKAGNTHGTSCLRVSDNTFYYPWARTLGHYKGRNGRPIAECKPLDETFFKYDYCIRNLLCWNRNLGGYTSGDHAVCFCYHFEGNNNYTGNYGNLAWQEDTNSANKWCRFSLFPGAYMAFVSAYWGSASKLFFDNTVANTEECIIMLEADSHDGYLGLKVQNCIFFCDEIVQFRWSRYFSQVTPSRGIYAQLEIYKICNKEDWVL